MLSSCRLQDNSSKCRLNIVFTTVWCVSLRSSLRDRARHTREKFSGPNTRVVSPGESNQRLQEMIRLQREEAEWVPRHMQQRRWPSESPARHQKVPAVSSNWGGCGGEERVALKRKIEMTRRISRSVTLCNRWVAGIHLPWETERENTLQGLQWDFSNYLLLHIWMRWAMRGLEACAALPPSENHLQGDFKNIPVMLQDKSLITGNYGLPISQPHPQLLPHPHYFNPLIQQEKQPGREERGWRGLLPGSRHWSWPLMLYRTCIHVEWFTCGQQLPSKWAVGPNWALWWSTWSDYDLPRYSSSCAHATVQYAFPHSVLSKWEQDETTAGSR